MGYLINGKERSLLILKDKKLEILSHFNIRASKKAIELLEYTINSENFVSLIRWAQHATNRSLGLKYLKEYFEKLLSEGTM
jgi:hypothetical protein